MLASIASLALLLVGCVGGFNLSRSLLGWNMEIENRWGRWGVFLAFVTPSTPSACSATCW
jgi:hypothetical protein